VENWQAYADGAGVPGAHPGPVAAAPPLPPEERARVLSLIGFLADYEARRNRPVRDTKAYDLFLLRDADLPEAAAVRLSPREQAWLTVDAPVGPEPGRPGAAKALHRDLFRQRDLLATDRASLELVWGFGRLRWAAGGTVVDHPLICVPVELEQDEASQQIRVCPAGAPEIEARCVAALPLADRAAFLAIRESLSDEGTDPWDAAALQGLLNPLVRAIDPDGTVVEDAPAPAAAAAVDGSWVLFMRRRRPDNQGFLERMRALYRDPAVMVPDTLRAVVTDSPPALAAAGPAAGTGHDTGAPPEPLLLPLPAHEEQQRILTQAQHSTGVTVQGPPGTGTSHTIANIISHDVAYGRRVLVVAEKEQALRALAGQIPAGIKDLTVSVLGADADSRRELESAIGRIQARVTALNQDFSGERIRQLTADLDAADRGIAVTTQALLATREAEVERLAGWWAPGEAPTRAEAARWVASQRPRLCYVDDLIAPGTPCPVGAGELEELIRLVREVGVARADACARDLPELTAIPFAAELEDRFEKLARLQASLRSLGDAVYDWGLAVACGREGLQALAARCHDEMEWIAKHAGTWLGHVQEQADDPLLAQDWLSFYGQLSADRQEALRLRGLLTAYRVVLPEPVDPALVDGLEQAKQRLSELGKLGMFAGPAKRAVQECEVDGRQPVTVADIDLCLQTAALDSLRGRIRTSWQNQVTRVSGAAELDAEAPEDALGPFLDDLERVLGWPRTWAQLRAELAAAGISSPAAADPDTLGRLADVCVRACDQMVVQELTRRFRSLDEWLRAGAQPASASPLWSQFADALSREDLARWHLLREELKDLLQVAPQARWLRDLRGRLSAGAPIWASRILADPAAAGDPADLDAAWQWRQLDSWVREALAGPTPAQLQARLEELSGQRRRIIAELVSERAWRRLADSLTGRQRQALNSYVRAVTRYGKAGGKYAQRWLTELRAARNESKDAIPVWIMPAARALTSFRPEADPPFDVLVVDEASRIGLEGVPLLALARKTIVVGDDQQASPEHAGLDREQVSGLLDQHLARIPKYRTLFDPDTSLYDIAFQKFPGVVMLTEHFRCLPQIIGFSNAHAYHDRIIPLRDLPPRPGWAPLGAVRVGDGSLTGTVNEPEADAVADLVAELCASPDYDGMDLGVISLLGPGQAKLIWDRLYDRLGPEVMARRRLRSGEPASFQGDERDVIIISAVAAADPALPDGRVAPMTGHAALQRINVAASRARQQMWIVYSADPDRFGDDDLRGALIRHCRDAGTAPAPPADLLEACESELERDVLRQILARGYRKVSVQHSVGRYRIDIVVEGPHARLAVECDGDRWDGPEAWHQDRARQQVLERAGWTFERIRGSAFYSDPEVALLPLWQRLAGLGIPAGDWWSAETPRPAARELPAAPGPAAAGAGDPQAGPSLLPYQAWPERDLPHPDTAPLPEVIAGLREIVAAEGPIRAQRAYRLYTRAAGGRRVGPEIRRAFHAATQQALQAGELRQLEDDTFPPDDKTLFVSGKPSVLLRELGPRQLWDVPCSEVAKLIKFLRLADAGDDAVKRAVLSAYGLVRLTVRTSQYLDKCLSYDPRRPAPPPVRGD